MKKLIKFIFILFCIVLTKSVSASNLPSGQEFNKFIKNNYLSISSNNINIIKFSSIEVPNDAVSVKTLDNGNITLFLNSEKTILYITSDTPIYFNENCSSMFSSVKVDSIDFSNVITSKTTDMSYMFNSAKLNTLDIKNWDFSNTTDMSYMFYQSNIETVDLSDVNALNVADMSYMFEISSIKYVNFSNFYAPKLELLTGMFNLCHNLISADFSDFNAKNLIKMTSMFKSCTGLTSVNFTNFNAPNVKYMDKLFCNCKKIETIDLSSFNTPNVEDIDNMFQDCKKLKYVNFSNFQTSKVKYMDNMFYNCENLEDVNLTSFDTSNVLMMNGMFKNCNSLKVLDLTSFDTSNVAFMSKMFYSEDGGSLETIYVSDKWTTNKALNETYAEIYKDDTLSGYNSNHNRYMMQKYLLFYGQTNLIGGNGTTYKNVYPNPLTTQTSSIKDYYVDFEMTEENCDIKYAVIDSQNYEGYLTGVVTKNKTEEDDQDDDNSENKTTIIDKTENETIITNETKTDDKTDANNTNDDIPETGSFINLSVYVLIISGIILYYITKNKKIYLKM